MMSMGNLASREGQPGGSSWEGRGGRAGRVGARIKRVGGMCHQDTHRYHGNHMELHSNQADDHNGWPWQRNHHGNGTPSQRELRGNQKNHSNGILHGNGKTMATGNMVTIIGWAGSATEKISQTYGL